MMGGMTNPDFPGLAGREEARGTEPLLLTDEPLLSFPGALQVEHFHQPV